MNEMLEDNIKRVDDKILEYLKDRFKSLQINILGKYEGSLIELMNRGKLEGWCWQSTESAIIFLNDDDYIERGNLLINNRDYYHSWICFKYNDEEYTLDPCLKYICKKEYYEKIFNTEVKGKVLAKDVKEELLKQISSDKEVIVNAKEDINTPLYRNGAGYKLEKENGIIKKLKVHYYYTDI